MSNWQRPGLPGNHLSITELHHVAVVSKSRVQYKHAADADVLEHVRIIPDIDGGA
jgi:hypothetical protein